eukprot:scaffold1436_cov250-Pinguiococcus_pyrenoidosus.AAC.12
MRKLRGTLYLFRAEVQHVVGCPFALRKLRAWIAQDHRLSLGLFVFGLDGSLQAICFRQDGRREMQRAVELPEEIPAGMALLDWEGEESASRVQDGVGADSHAHRLPRGGVKEVSDRADLRKGQGQPGVEVFLQRQEAVARADGMELAEDLGDALLHTGFAQQEDWLRDARAPPGCDPRTSAVFAAPVLPVQLLQARFQLGHVEEVLEVLQVLVVRRAGLPRRSATPRTSPSSSAIRWFVRPLQTEILSTTESKSLKRLLADRLNPRPVVLADLPALASSRMPEASAAVLREMRPRPALTSASETSSKRTPS